jgi:hypothetical protein
MTTLITPTLTVRQYSPESGALLNNINVLQFGKITTGTKSRVAVIDVAFSDVTAVSNIKIGLVSSGGLTVNTNPTDITSDGSSSTGHFGIESSSTFDSVKASSPLARHFAGLNVSRTAADVNNVAVGNRSDTISDYIYLDVEIGSADIRSGSGAYKIYFDFS